MNLENKRFISRLPTQLSKVKLLILISLLDEGTQFPRGWVEGSKLLYATNQKNFERHVIELRDELGCNIEIKEIHGENCYRLVSYDLIKPKPKPKPEPKPEKSIEDNQKDALLFYSNNCCQLCGVKMIPGVRDLHVDQKIPAAKGGAQEFSNWQVICNDCNVSKRRNCNQCGDDCNECSWAFPERIEGMTIINLPQDILKRINNIGLARRQDIEKLIISSLDTFLEE